MPFLSQFCYSLRFRPDWKPCFMRKTMIWFEITQLTSPFWVASGTTLHKILLLLAKRVYNWHGAIKKNPTKPQHLDCHCLQEVFGTPLFEHWTTWDGDRRPCVGWDRRMLKVPSTPNPSGIHSGIYFPQVLWPRGCRELSGIFATRSARCRQALRGKFRNSLFFRTLETLKYHKERNWASPGRMKRDFQCGMGSVIRVLV